MEMQLDGQLGAFFHILHGGRNGDGQIEFNSPAVDITQSFEAAGKANRCRPGLCWMGWLADRSSVAIGRPIADP